MRGRLFATSVHACAVLRFILSSLQHSKRSHSSFALDRLSGWLARPPAPSQRACLAPWCVPERVQDAASPAAAPWSTRRQSPPPLPPPAPLRLHATARSPAARLPRMRRRLPRPVLRRPTLCIQLALPAGPSSPMPQPRRPPASPPLLTPPPPWQADDPELEAIRQRRMAQLMGQQGGGPGGGPKSAEEAAAAEEAKAAAEEQRRAMLMNLMQPSARDRRELAVPGPVWVGGCRREPAADRLSRPPHVGSPARAARLTSAAQPEPPCLLCSRFAQVPGPRHRPRPPPLRLPALVSMSARRRSGAHRAGQARQGAGDRGHADHGGPPRPDTGEGASLGGRAGGRARRGQTQTGAGAARRE